MVSKPALPRAQVSRPVTALGWNQIIESIDALYNAIPTVGVQVVVTFRDGPVPQARVVAVPAAGGPGGPPIEGVPDGGDGTGFQLRGLHGGPWTIYVEAPWFAPWKQNVSVPPPLSGGPISTVKAELIQTHVLVPDLVGFPAEMARTTTLAWTGFALGAQGDAKAGTAFNTTVIAQGPAPGTPVPIGPLPFGLRGSFARPLAAVHMVVSQIADGANPTRTIVPDVVGWREPNLSFLVGTPVLRQGPESLRAGATDPLRVVAQDPPAGTAVPVLTAVAVTLDQRDGATMAFGAFPGTHSKLSGQPVKPIADRLGANPRAGLTNGPLPGLSPFAQSRPWSLARWYLDEAEVQAIKAFFASIGAPITGAPGEGLAAAWASLHLAIVVALEPK